MQGKLDIRYDLPDNAKLKSRFLVPEGKDFTKECRAAIGDAVLEILNTNQLTVRSTIERKLKEAGLTIKKEAYQKHIDADNKSMLRCSFFTKSTPAEGSEPAPAEVPAEEGDEPEVQPVEADAEPENASKEADQELD